MKIKVCGLSINEENQLLSEFPEIDFLGFIFYSNSKRYVSSTFVSPKNKVGVFVNETAQMISETIENEDLYAIQLHGNESPLECLNFSEKVVVIKAFNIGTETDFEQCYNFENKVDFFLFDSKSEEKGGSGKSFDWELLNKYSGNTPFFLSGGIGPTDVEKIKSVKHPQFFGIDINSRFEDSPGIKNIETIKNFIKELV